MLCYLAYLLGGMLKYPYLLLISWVIPQVPQFMSLDRRYYSNFKHNCSGYMVSFAISLSKKEAIKLIRNLKNEISPFLASKASERSTSKYLPSTETNIIDYRLLVYRILYSIVFAWNHTS